MQTNNLFKIFIFTISLGLFSTILLAQNETKAVFYIQLGLLRYPDTLQFASLRELGNLYEEKSDNDMTRILLGKYADRSLATEKLKLATSKGFLGLFLVQRQESDVISSNIKSTNSSVPPPIIYAVQLGAFTTKIPSTENIEKYGKIFSVKESKYTKLRIGYFHKEEDALAVLNRVRAYGFSKAGLYVLHQPLAASGHDFFPQTEALAFQSASFYKRMQGKINGSQLIVVHLYYTENSFSGHYTDPNTAERKKFTYHGVNLNDKSQNKQKEVYITRFGDDSFGLSFGIKDKETGKENVFSLNEQYQKGAAHFDVVTVYRKKIKKLATGEIGADVFVEYPIMSDYTDKSVEKKFNALSLQFSETKSESNINAKIEHQLLADLNQINKYFPKYNWISETYENRIIENSNYLLSIRYHIENILATPKTSIKHKTFNLKNGQEIKLTNLFSGNYTTELKKIIEAKLKLKATKLKLTNNEITGISNKMLQNFYVTSYGVVFFYDRNTDNKQGSLEISLPYRELKTILKTDFVNEFGLK
jgi:hypothetical protein